VSARIEIDGRPVGAGCAPYVVAEVSANHNGSIERAREIISRSALAGAHAIKLQTYTADTITMDVDREAFHLRDGPWAGRTLYELYDWAHTPWEWHEELFQHARSLGLTAFSSPFDATAIDFLESLGCPVYKIASFEVVDLPLIARAATTRKPLIISTGMASEDEIGEAVETARRGGCSALALLHCVSAYPAPADEYNLATIPELARRFEAVAGLSDHTTDNVAAICSVMLGAGLIEKHVTLSRSDGGPDGSFSLEPEEFANLCRDVRTAWEALGQCTFGAVPSESVSKRFRRSLYFTRNLRAGDVIGPHAIRSIRPGEGLPPKYLERVLGNVCLQDQSAGDPVLASSLAHPLE